MINIVFLHNIWRLKYGASVGIIIYWYCCKLCVCEHTFFVNFAEGKITIADCYCKFDWLGNCLDVFTDSHFQVKLWSVLNMLSECLFVSLIICWCISFLVSRRKLSTMQPYISVTFSPLYLLSSGHLGHFLSNFNGHKYQSNKPGEVILSCQFKRR